MDLDQGLQRIVELRSDIVWSRFSENSDSMWVARDPISLEYFYFSAEERAIALLFNGSRSLSDILQACQQHSSAWMLEFASRLESACLTVPRNGLAIGRRLWRAHQGHVLSQKLHRRLLNPLAFRIKLWDPTRLLVRLTLLANFLFHRWFVVGCLVAGGLVSYLVLLKALDRWTTTNLISTIENVSFERWAALFLTFLCVKSIHELGHALACRKWGAECHELGVYFFLLSPCLYCDTSDTWRIPNRLRRAAVAAAGIYVELLVAIVAGIVWLATQTESSLHFVAENTIFICTLNTVLVNANPLLRYDGYYVLSDLWGIPNLADQSRDVLETGWLCFATGKAFPRQRWRTKPWLLAFYGLASISYRYVVLAAVLGFIWMVLGRYGMHLLAAGLILWVSVQLALRTLQALFRGLESVRMHGGFLGRRLAVLLGGTILLGLFFFCIPLPSIVFGRVVTLYAEMTPIYAKQDGTLNLLVTDGQRVKSGEPLMKISSPTLQVEWIELRGQVEYLKERQHQLQLRSVDDESAASELADVVQQLAKAQQGLDLLTEQIEDLATFAEHDGLVISKNASTAVTLTEYSQSVPTAPVLTVQQQASSVERGELLGWLARPEKYLVKAYVLQPDAELMSPGMQVRVRWDCALEQTCTGSLRSISPEPIAITPEPLIGDYVFPSTSTTTGGYEPAHACYEAILEIPQLPPSVGHQSLATAYIYTSPRTLYQTLRRAIGLQLRSLPE